MISCVLSSLNLSGKWENRGSFDEDLDGWEVGEKKQGAGWSLLSQAGAPVSPFHRFPKFFGYESVALGEGGVRLCIASC
jgi:hypothetical protein